MKKIQLTLALMAASTLVAAPKKTKKLMDAMGISTASTAPSRVPKAIAAKKEENQKQAQNADEEERQRQTMSYVIHRVINVALRLMALDLSDMSRGPAEVEELNLLKEYAAQQFTCWRLTFMQNFYKHMTAFALCVPSSKEVVETQTLKYNSELVQQWFEEELKKQEAANCPCISGDICKYNKALKFTLEKVDLHIGNKIMLKNRLQNKSGSASASATATMAADQKHCLSK